MVVTGIRGPPSTLLGPEATGRLTHCWSLFFGAGERVVWGVECFWRTRVTEWHTRPAGETGVGGCGSLWWVRPLLENCIVDASIFEFFQDCFVMIAGLRGLPRWVWLMIGSMLSWFL